MVFTDTFSSKFLLLYFQLVPNDFNLICIWKLWLASEYNKVSKFKFWDLQACRLIARNFAIKWTPSQVFFDIILSPPMLPPCIDFSPPPHPILKSPPPPGPQHLWETLYMVRCLSTPFRVNTPQQSEEDVGIYYTEVYQSDIVP